VAGEAEEGELDRRALTRGETVETAGDLEGGDFFFMASR
jgi:hypothetical protein